jgi:Mrp family chromosome partitioning ATPase
LLKNLEKIILPGVNKSLVQMGYVRDVSISDEAVGIKLASACLDPDMMERIKAQVEKTAAGAETAKVNVTFEDIKPKELNRIGNVIAVMSGKGGVGKSLVSGLLAIALRKHGFNVGIMDADITGPSIPRMFGVKEAPHASNSGMLPPSSKTGIEIMSLNLLLPSEDEAVIWRGPLIGKVITQFWEEVLWGNLDFLVVDLPPGTADAPLTVLQQLPVTGVVIVSSPQDLASMIVRKAVRMAVKMEKHIVGVVENMSYLHIPELDKDIEIFGKSQGEEMAKAAGAPLLAKIPIDPKLAALCDKGQVEDYDSTVIDDLWNNFGAAE